MSELGVLGCIVDFPSGQTCSTNNGSLVSSSIAGMTYAMLSNQIESIAISISFDTKIVGEGSYIPHDEYILDGDMTTETSYWDGSSCDPVANKTDLCGYEIVGTLVSTGDPGVPQENGCLWNFFGVIEFECGLNSYAVDQVVSDLSVTIEKTLMGAELESYLDKDCAVSFSYDLSSDAASGSIDVASALTTCAVDYFQNGLVEIGFNKNLKLYNTGDLNVPFCSPLTCGGDLSFSGSDTCGNSIVASVDCPSQECYDPERLDATASSPLASWGIQENLKEYWLAQSLLGNGVYTEDSGNLNFVFGTKTFSTPISSYIQNLSSYNGTISINITITIME